MRPLRLLLVIVERQDIPALASFISGVRAGVRVIGLAGGRAPAHVAVIPVSAAAATRVFSPLVTPTCATPARVAHLIVARPPVATPTYAGRTLLMKTDRSSPGAVVSVAVNNNHDRGGRGDRDLVIDPDAVVLGAIRRRNRRAVDR